MRIDSKALPCDPKVIEVMKLSDLVDARRRHEAGSLGKLETKGLETLISNGITTGNRNS